MVTIKVNNQTITIANKSSESFDIDKQFVSIESFGDEVNKDIKQLNIISNVKAMEAFGYKSTEGVGETIKNAAVAAWEKIKTWLGKLWNFIKNIGKFFKQKFAVKPNMKFVKQIAEKFKKKSPEEAKTLNEKEAAVVGAYDKANKMDNILKSTFSGMMNSVRRIAGQKDAVDESSPEVVESQKQLQDVVDKFNDIKQHSIDGAVAAAGKLIPENIVDATYGILDRVDKEIQTSTAVINQSANVGNVVAANLASKSTQAVQDVTGASKEIVAAIAAYIAEVDKLVKQESGGKVSLNSLNTQEKFDEFMAGNDTLVL